MRERGSGVIVNVSSIAGARGLFRSAGSTRPPSTRSKRSPRRFTTRSALERSGSRSSSRAASTRRFDNNRKTFACDEAPYDELDEIWEQVAGQAPGPGPGNVRGPRSSQTIADAVEGKEQKLRWPVGDDAKLVLDGSRVDERRGLRGDDAVVQSLEPRLVRPPYGISSTRPNALRLSMYVAAAASASGNVLSMTTRRSPFTTSVDDLLHDRVPVTEHQLSAEEHAGEGQVAFHRARQDRRDDVRVLHRRR